MDNRKSERSEQRARASSGRKQLDQRARTLVRDTIETADSLEALAHERKLNDEQLAAAAGWPPVFDSALAGPSALMECSGRLRRIAEDVRIVSGTADEPPIAA